MLPHARPPVSSPYPLPVCPLYLSRSVAVTWSLCLPLLFAYHVFIITITAPNPIIRVSAGVILRSGRALVSEISFSRWLNFSPPPLCNEKNFSSKPRSDFFEQSKGVGGHFVHICYTHMSHVYFLYLAPLHRTRLPIARRRTVRFRRPRSYTYRWVVTAPSRAWSRN